jgi:diadenosine tetraphosphatase ApaH/serine/threonine PP2A family protein phosphatase
VVKRLAILADVHGNLPALEAVLADAGRQGVDNAPGRLIVAGDSTGGSHSRQVVDRLRALEAWAIRGNNEDYLLTYHRGEAPADWYTASRWAPIRLVYQQFDAAGLEYLASLPQQRVVALEGTLPLRVVHGSPRDPIEHLVPDGDAALEAQFRRAGIRRRDPRPLAALVAGVVEPLLVCAHSHIAWQQQVGGCRVVNPGSVGAPINGDWRAQYALLTWQKGGWQVTLRAVAYDRAQMWAQAHESGFLAGGGAFARACLLGSEIGQNVPGFLVDHAIGVAARSGHTWNDMPEEVWERAVAAFDWDAYGPAREEAR